MRIRKLTLNTWIIACFLILMENCFYFIDVDSFPLGYSDLWLLILVAYYGYQYLKRSNRRVSTGGRKYNYKPVMWLLVLIVLVSSMQAFLEYDQSIFLGLRPQRRFLFVPLTYYGLRLQFNYKEINFENIETIIIKLGIIQSILYCIQQAVFSQIVFLNMSYNYRYGSVRLYIDSAVIVFMILFSFNRYIRNNKMYNLFPVVLGIYYELTVSKGRLECLAIFFAIIITFLLWREFSGRKLFGCILLICAIVIFANTSIFDNFVTAVEIRLGVVQQVSYLDTMEIRNSAHVFYWDELLKTPLRFLAGCGYPNTDFQPAAVASGFSEGYIFADNGVFAFIYAYGFLGVVFLLYMYVRFARNAITIYKQNQDLRYLTFGIFILAISYNIIFWWWKAEWTYIMAILFAVTEYEVACIKREYPML